METGNDKPLSMGAGVETSEIWSLKSVPEICGASWSGIETIMKADVSVWYHKFYHQKGLWKRESYLVHFNMLIILHRAQLWLECSALEASIEISAKCIYILGMGLPSLYIVGSSSGVIALIIRILTTLTSLLSGMYMKKILRKTKELHTKKQNE